VRIAETQGCCCLSETCHVSPDKSDYRKLTHYRISNAGDLGNLSCPYGTTSKRTGLKTGHYKGLRRGRNGRKRPCGSRRLAEKLFEKLLSGQIEIGGYVAEDLRESANFEPMVHGNGDVVFCAFAL